MSYLAKQQRPQSHSIDKLLDQRNQLENHLQNGINPIITQKVIKEELFEIKKELNRRHQIRSQHDLSQGRELTEMETTPLQPETISGPEIDLESVR